MRDGTWDQGCESYDQGVETSHVTLSERLFDSYVDLNIPVRRISAHQGGLAEGTYTSQAPEDLDVCLRAVSCEHHLSTATWLCTNLLGYLNIEAGNCHS